ncbi:MAG TPA: DNA-binding response regulator [Flavobacterium sp.]|nr:DNA-binding response regulator [Flavobacterium sp.]
MKIQKQKIVLIEDDAALGNSILELLQLNNFEVTWFDDSTQALVYLTQNIPDLIISDLMMPKMNGGELFFQIRKNKKFTTVPYIIITANVDDETKLRQLELGVNDYIMKPFKVKELIFKVNNVLELRKNIEKNFGIDPFSKVTIKLSEKDFLTSLNELLLKAIKTRPDLDELSKNLFISKSTLDKRIRKLTNKNISQYIREFKIQYAMKLIHLGERNIQYLVDETGFASFSYFSTSFKAYCKMSPRDYIKSVQVAQFSS